MMRAVCRVLTFLGGAVGLPAVAVALMSGCASTKSAGRISLEMPYPAKGEVAAGDIYHVPTGLKMAFDNVMNMVSGATLVSVGETHDNIHAHEVELAVIRELHKRFPGKIAIGMEMFRSPQQAALDNWVAGGMTEREFVKATKWYANWGSDYGYYRDILAFARENRIDVVALNPPKELEKAVAHSGFDNIPETLRSEVPDVGEPDPFQRAMLKAVYGAHMPSEGMFESFFRTQLVWEETMARRIVDYLESPRGRGKKMVTISGGWHVRYGFGIPKKVIRRMPMPYAILLPDEIETPPDKEDQLMDVDLPAVPLFPADFLWAVRYEGLEGKRAKMGVVLQESAGKVVVERVLALSPAEKAGIGKGDEIVSIDAQPVADMADVQYALSGKEIGGRGTVVVRRDGAEKTFDLEYIAIPKPKRHP